MIVISPKLFADFQKITLEGYIEQKLNEYAKRNPAAYDATGEDNYRRYIESAIVKTDFLGGLKSEAALNSILTLMDHYGHGFEADPLYDWVWLNKYPESTKKLEQIDILIREYIEETIGPNNEIYEAALNKFIETDIKELTGLKDEMEIMRALQEFYPERLDFIDRSSLMDKVLPLARDKARQMVLTTPVGMFLTAYAMFMLGSFFDSDPRYEQQLGLDAISFNPEITMMNALKKHFKSVLENNKQFANND